MCDFQLMGACEEGVMLNSAHQFRTHNECTTGTGTIEGAPPSSSLTASNSAHVHCGIIWV